MSEKPETCVSSRRKFILNAAAATGGAMVANVAGAAPSEPAPARSPQAAARGYRETEHVRKYYEKARI